MKYIKGHCPDRKGGTRMNGKTRRMITVLLCLILTVSLLSGCSGDGKPRQSVSYDWFDTVSTVTSYRRESEKTFETNAAEVFRILEHYHRLFDIYHEYDGLNNLCTVNRLAGGEPVPVDREIISFLKECISLYKASGYTVNVMMGSVLRLWKEAGNLAESGPGSASVPSEEELRSASGHISPDLLEIDEAAGTVRISDPEASLDVGAIAKGYAAEMAAQYLRDNGLEGYVLNVGGNICVTGSKPDGSGWLTGVRNPDLESDQAFAAKIDLRDTCCVTSGNYERFFTVDGVRYHHIIDPDTMMPARYFASVTVVTENSTLADMLSTALFCMSLEEGRVLLEAVAPDAAVLWITETGEQFTNARMDQILAEGGSQ